MKKWLPLCALPGPHNKADMSMELPESDAVDANANALLLAVAEVGDMEIVRGALKCNANIHAAPVFCRAAVFRASQA